MSEHTLMDLHEKEKQLYNQEEELRLQEWKVAQMEEDYCDHFTQTKQVFEELNYLFHDSSAQSFYEGAIEDFLSDSQFLMNQLEEGKDAIERQRRAIQSEIDDIHWEKQRMEKER